MLMFGGPTQIREECRELRPLHWVGTLGADLRYAVRTLRVSPVFTSAAILSIARPWRSDFYSTARCIVEAAPGTKTKRALHLVRSDGVEDDWSYSWPLYEELRDAVAP